MPRPKIENIDRDKFSEQMHSESDRACAILGAALLDAKLENLFLNRLHKFHKELLKGTGPISTFSARIRLANALVWIGDAMQAELDIIRRIRNDFAHSFDHELSFEDESVAGRCKNLCVAQAYIDGFDLAIKVPNQNLSKHALEAIKATFQPPRSRFQLTIDFISQYLDDISENESGNIDSDFLQEVRDLSTNIRFKLKASGTVSAQ